MPQSRSSRPPRPPRATPEQLRWARAHIELIAWKEAVQIQSWLLVREEGGRMCGDAQYARGARSLIEQGVTPPPGVVLQGDYLINPDPLPCPGVEPGPDAPSASALICGFAERGELVLETSPPTRVCVRRSATGDPVLSLRRIDE